MLSLVEWTVVVQRTLSAFNLSRLLQLLNFINQLYILFLIDNERCSIYSLFVAEEYEC